MPARTLTALPTIKNQAATRAIQVVLYARVSSKDQEKEGFSIPAQLRLLREYANDNGFVIAHEFTDVETAKETGRSNFGQMLGYLKKHAGICRTILVERTDRLYRNIKDFATVDELGVEIHLVKENEIISRDSRSSEQFVHGIKVLMARNYSLNLGEETIKGMTEKASTRATHQLATETSMAQTASARLWPIPMRRPSSPTFLNGFRLAATRSSLW